MRIPIFDTIRIHFADGSSTVEHVLDDDSLQDAAVNACEELGIDSRDVTSIKIISTTYKDGE